jgi:hypothetical protein
MRTRMLLTRAVVPGTQLGTLILVAELVLAVVFGVARELGDPGSAWSPRPDLASRRRTGAGVVGGHLLAKVGLDYGGARGRRRPLPGLDLDRSGVTLGAQNALLSVRSSGGTAAGAG